MVASFEFAENKCEKDDECISLCKRSLKFKRKCAQKWIMVSQIVIVHRVSKKHQAKGNAFWCHFNAQIICFKATFGLKKKTPNRKIKWHIFLQLSAVNTGEFCYTSWEKKHLMPVSIWSIFLCHLKQQAFWLFSSVGGSIDTSRLTHAPPHSLRTDPKYFQQNKISYSKVNLWIYTQ